MSYDVYIFAKSSKKALTRESFNKYFADRAHFECEENDAYYHNQYTGVQFSFSFFGSAEEDVKSFDKDDPTAPPYPHIVFSLNYRRPSFFAEESEIELSACVKHFAAVVQDPQYSEEASMEYDAEVFISNWKQSNELVIRQFLAKAEAIDTMPTAVLESDWQWNKDCPKLAKKFEGVHVAPVIYVRYQGQVRRAAIWTDGLPILIPYVDGVVVVRDVIKKRTEESPEAEPDSAYVPFKDISSLLKDCPRGQGPTQYIEVSYKRPSRFIQDYLANKPAANKADLKILTVEQILPRETVGAR
ncbi:MAG: hypothetical protein SFV17_00410 [Candidatus Obscuribacter sp.]|nr:hypothetical protein [Candidatus Melainabacteria bacterium]MDX1985125.1 hypothetical protein [Candidatus Obscuribacter sp.]